MGGRLYLTMHGASVGSWGIPRNAKSRKLRDRGRDQSLGLDMGRERRADRRACPFWQLSPLGAETSFSANALAVSGSSAAVLQKSQRRT